MAHHSVFEDLRKELFHSSNLESEVTEQQSHRLHKIVQSLNSLYKQCPDSLFKGFLEECAISIVEKATKDSQSVAAWIIFHRQLIEGLLHLMVLDQSAIDLFSPELHEEASIVKLSFLFRLFLIEFRDIIQLPQNPLSLSVVQAGFQLFLDLFQNSKLIPVFSQDGIFWHGAWNLLEDLQQFNQDEWDACLATVLHQILSCYVSNGPTVLQEAPIKFLLKLFSKPCFARRFLDSITLCPDSRNSSIDRGALNAALQIFEAAYKMNPLTIATCCASKIVDAYSDSAFLRLECLACKFSRHGCQVLQEIIGGSSCRQILRHCKLWSCMFDGNLISFVGGFL